MKMTKTHPLRLTLDATYALDPQPTGVARYSTRLIEALGERDDLAITLASRPKRYGNFPSATARRIVRRSFKNRGIFFCR